MYLQATGQDRAGFCLAGANISVAVNLEVVYTILQKAFPNARITPSAIKRSNSLKKEICSVSLGDFVRENVKNITLTVHIVNDKLS